ncbi:hypothetical protein NBRC110019_05130 [Neptunitalea chrysea]|uniref:Uncharacterized protein n=1 Tax=Neptunitalea chrysea TaxID=1647581 RepID=A0A9W6B325_9FLAO|nr:hypothetical protein NBRC110019_05130 [Neptunitalea chrysea]
MFIGRAYQFYFFGAPFREFLWDESFLSPIVEGVFNTPWYDYATSPLVNKWIEFVTKGFSIVLLLGAFISLFWQQITWIKVKKSILGFGIFILILLGICLVKSKRYDPLQFFELSIQFAAIFVLFFSKNSKIANKRRLLFWLRVTIALVFISHGLFAMGLIYVPGHFIDMSISILGTTEAQTKHFLFVFGLLDVVASILIFVPKLYKYAFIYIIVWGIVTALARLVSGFNSDFVLNSFHQFLYLTIYRLPHGLMPLATFMLYKEFEKQPKN